MKKVLCVSPKIFLWSSIQRSFERSSDEAVRQTRRKQENTYLGKNGSPFIFTKMNRYNSAQNRLYATRNIRVDSDKTYPLCRSMSPRTRTSNAFPQCVKTFTKRWTVLCFVWCIIVYRSSTYREKYTSDWTDNIVILYKLL